MVWKALQGAWGKQEHEDHERDGELIGCGPTHFPHAPSCLLSLSPRSVGRGGVGYSLRPRTVDFAGEEQIEVHDGPDETEQGDDQADRRLSHPGEGSVGTADRTLRT